MLEVGKAPRRSKAASLDALKAKLGRVALRDITRERLIQFGRDRAKEGAGPVTVGIDLGYVKTVLTHAAAVHGVAISPEPVDLARVALKRIGHVGCGRERDCRPTQSELDRLYAHFDANPRQIIPLSRIVRFAIATAMRQDEICRIAWKDVDEEHRTVLVRNRKDPRDKAGNDQKLPLLDATGLDAWALLAEQWRFSRGPGRVFPTRAVRSARLSGAPAGSCRSTICTSTTFCPVPVRRGACSLGLRRLQAYRKEWHESRACGRTSPGMTRPRTGPTRSSPSPAATTRRPPPSRPGGGT